MGMFSFAIDIKGQLIFEENKEDFFLSDLIFISFFVTVNLIIFFYRHEATPVVFFVLPLLPHFLN